MLFFESFLARLAGDYTIARFRRGFRNIRAYLACPTRVPKPTGTGPGRPPGAKNKHKAPRDDVGKTVRRRETCKAIGKKILVDQRTS